MAKQLLLLDFETDGIIQKRPLEVAGALVEIDGRSLRIIEVVNRFFEHPSEPQHWESIDFHEANNYTELWVQESKVPVDTLEGTLLDLLGKSTSSQKPMLCARNVNFEKTVLEVWAPRVLGQLHPYRYVELTTIDLHPTMADFGRQLGMSHVALEDVYREVEILTAFLEMELR